MKECITGGKQLLSANSKIVGYVMIAELFKQNTPHWVVVTICDVVGNAEQYLCSYFSIARICGLFKECHFSSSN
jgi:hypothetical protein